MKAALLLLTLALATARAADPVVIKLWPKGAPEPEGFVAAGPESTVDKGDGIQRTSNVTEPTLTLYRPEKPNGCAVIVAPGGGYGILAIEHEGTQVCDYLVKQGVTCALLKYRVPRRDPANPGKEPLQDAQRAIGLLRHRAAEFGIDPSRIGMLGFSAGGHLTVMTTLRPDLRSYETDPALDVEDPTPAFAIPVYPAYLVSKEDQSALLPEVKVTDQAPPLCLVHAHDDKGTTSAAASALLYLEYKKLNLPCELHIYAKGGHGFGMRKAGNPVNDWPLRCAEWMQAMGWLGQ